MDLSILDKILEDANNIYDELYKNSNIIGTLLHLKCINFNTITYSTIDNIKKRFIENLTIFSESLEFIDLQEITNNDIEQLFEIITDDELIIFKLAGLFNNDINIYIKQIEKDMYKDAYEILSKYSCLSKLQLFESLTSNAYIYDLLYNITQHYKSTDDLENLYMNNYQNRFIKPLELDTNNGSNNFDLEQLKKIIEEICLSKDNVECILLDELDYTLWNDKVLLYEIRNKKNYDFLYVYFDLYKRNDKTVNDCVIKLYKNRLCICTNLDDIISDNNLQVIKNNIMDIIDIII